MNIANAISFGQGKALTAKNDLLSAYTLVESLHEILKVWEQVRVGKMLV